MAQINSKASTSIRFLLPDISIDWEAVKSEQCNRTRNATNPTSARGKYKASDEKYPRSRTARLSSSLALIWAKFKLFLHNICNDDDEPDGDVSKERTNGADKEKRSNRNPNAQKSTEGGASNAGVGIAPSIPTFLNNALKDVFDSRDSLFQCQVPTLSQTDVESGSRSDTSPTWLFRDLWPDRSEIEHLRHQDAQELRKQLAARRTQMLFLSREPWTEEIKSKSDEFRRMALGAGRRRSVPFDLETALEVEAEMETRTHILASKRTSKGRDTFVGGRGKERSVNMEAWWKTEFGKEDVIMEEDEEPEEEEEIEKENYQRKDKGKERARDDDDPSESMGGHVIEERIEQPLELTLEGFKWVTDIPLAIALRADTARRRRSSMIDFYRSSYCEEDPDESVMGMLDLRWDKDAVSNDPGSSACASSGGL